MASFDEVDFDVRISNDATFPLPSADENGFLWYEATLRCTRSAYDDLDELLTAIDIIPAMGMRAGGTVARRWGPGSAELIFPAENGTERTRDAILVSLTAVGEHLRDIVELDARWLLLEGI